jgi:hypothetical protein
MKQFEILNPVGESEAARVFIAPRLKELDKKKIGLFWNGKNNGDIVLLKIGEYLRRKFDVKELIRFDHGFEGIGPAAIKEIAEKSDLVISSLGD